MKVQSYPERFCTIIRKYYSKVLFKRWIHRRNEGVFRAVVEK